MDRPEAMEEKRRWQGLPDDLLVDILRRVAALRDLAVSRCVCKAWRAATDDALLLRAELRPHSLAGLFINYIHADINFSELISRPSSSAAVKYPRYMTVEDHCNGLLLCYRSVLNPATGRRAPVPEPPPPPAHAGMEDFPQDTFLVCDPTVSPHYEVFSIPRVETKDEDFEFVKTASADGFRRYNLQAKHRDTTLLASEWPPSPFILNVFSSVTGQWENRLFHRDGEAAGTVADMRLDYPSSFCRRHAVYYRAALYVHCEHYFIVRLSLPDNKYQVIKPPSIALCKKPQFHLGRSQKGIYYALLDEQSRLRVWNLDESRGNTDEWELNHDSVCGLLKPSLNCIQKAYGPWMLHDINCNKDKETEALGEHESEWDSDDENIPHCQDSGQNRRVDGYLDILAFHPYKEIVFFLRKTLSRLIAYHLNTSKLEDLGSLSPDNTEIDETGMCFPYTPCTIREFPER